MSSETHTVRAVVVALVPEYNQAMVLDGEGRQYSITRKTRGIDLATLREGQEVECTVTVHLPRVLAAAAVD